MTERSLTGALLLSLGAVLIAGATIGPFPLSPGRMIAVLGGDRSDAQAVTVLLNIRLPRVLAAAVVGAALAAAGAAYQTTFRNPLVSPDILGVSAGAGFGAVLGILLGLPVIGIQMLGFGTGLLTVGLVLALSLALRGTGQVLVMVLCGIAIGALAGAGISLVKLLADPEQQLPAITFWLMGSLIPPLGGRITLDGQPLAELSRTRIASRLAHVPQALATPFAFTALDIVLMGAAAGPGPFARPGKRETARARAALHRLGIADLAGTEVTSLSGGQRQLVLIARALAQDAAAIIMDEPTASLDFANRRQVNEAIRWLVAQGTAIILSTHDPDQAAAVGDRAVLLNRGGVVAAGRAEQALTAANLSQLYGIPVHRDHAADGRVHFY